MLESVICLPFLFLLLFMTAQLAHIMFCRQVIQYAAVAAGRAVISASEAQETEAATAAARRICALISYTDEGGTPLQREWLKYDGRDLDGSGGAASDANPQKLEVSVSGTGAVGTRKIEVKFWTPMLFPFAGEILAGGLKWYRYTGDDSRDLSHYQYAGRYFRHIQLSGRTVIFKMAAGSDSGINYGVWN